MRPGCVYPCASGGFVRWLLELQYPRTDLSEDRVETALPVTLCRGRLLGMPGALSALQPGLVLFYAPKQNVYVIRIMTEGEYNRRMIWSAALPVAPVSILIATS